jgi:hypothetical protein
MRVGPGNDDEEDEVCMRVADAGLDEMRDAL